jgi:photosystem II oxygen-evolving enhancer protein 3
VQSRRSILWIAHQQLEPPPTPFGGLPGTENADEARDTDLPLKEKFFIQPLSPAYAALRAKFSAQDILASKTLIDKEQWPYVQSALRNSTSYLRYDLNTRL